MTFKRTLNFNAITVIMMFDFLSTCINPSQLSYIFKQQPIFYVAMETGGLRLNYDYVITHSTRLHEVTGGCEKKLLSAPLPSQ